MHELSVEFNALEIQSIQYIKKAETESINGSTSKKDMEVALQARELEGETFMQIAEIAMTIISKRSSCANPVVSVVWSTIEQLKQQMQKFEVAQRDYITLIGIEKGREEMKWTLKYREILHVRELDAAKILDKHSHSEKIDHHNTGDSRIHLERIKPPKFSGDIRDYPRFKSDFQRLVANEIKKTSTVAYILRDSLSGTPADLVRNIDDNLEEMWKRLDEKYGEKTKLIDVVMTDLKRLKPLKNKDYVEFIKMVELIERGYRDLERLGLEAEMNATTVSMVEEKLPPDIKMKWSEEVRGKETKSKVESSGKFPYMLEFLLERKGIIEYNIDEMRSYTPHEKADINHMGLDNSTGDYPRVRCVFHQSNAHLTTECNAYNDLSGEDKEKLIRDSRACWSCLKTGHRSARCLERKRCTKSGCNFSHHESLPCPSTQGGSVSHTNVIDKTETRTSNPKGDCLLQLMNIKAKPSSPPANVFWDGGATLSLITFRKAKALGLHGEPVKLSVTVIGGKKQDMESFRYDLNLIDRDSRIVHFIVYGIDQISTNVSNVDLSKIRSMFKSARPEAFRRPVGEIDILIGFEYAGYHPVTIQSANHLVVMENRFGHCIGGQHPLLKETTRKLVQHVSISHVKHVKIDDFYNIESLGVQCNPQCGNCKCGKCPIGGKNYSIKEEREHNLIDKAVVHKGDYWEASYPWIKNPENLPDNRNAAIATLRSTERRLMRNQDMAKLYQEQINDMVKRKVARVLTPEEIKSYNGPVHYINHHAVLKPDSKTTPCRIVFNSSASYQGHVLNNYWAKGPDLMNNMLGIILRFRGERVAITGDIRKMYHAVKIPLLDQHTHQFL